MMKKYKIFISVTFIASLILCLTLWQQSDTPVSNAEKHVISNPRVEDGISTWDCVYFGYYFQSGDTVKDAIKWRVLSVDGDDAFLLADKNLDCQPYNKEYTHVTWETCSVRNWLNNAFLNNAFTEEEQCAIQVTKIRYNYTSINTTEDKIYLLSPSESLTLNYGFSSKVDKTETRMAKNTPYATAQGTFTSDLGNGTWWLRYSDSSHASWVSNYGRCYEEDNLKVPVDSTDIAVRPALHLNLSSSEWSYAGTVSSNGEENALPSPTPIATAEPTPTPSPTPVPTPTPTSKPTATPPVIPTQTPDTADNTPPAPTDSQNEQPAVSTPSKTVSAPGRPQKLTVKNNKTKTITVSWKKVKKANGYQVQYAANTAFSKKKVKNTKKTKLVIRKLKKKKTYCFRVRAYKATNGAKKYGKWSKVKKIKIKK